MTPPIAIVGAGPCGLTIARLLEMNKIEYVVFDRDASGETFQGGSLDIHEQSGQAALKEAGLLDEFKKLARYGDQLMTIMDEHGEVAVRAGGDEHDTGRPEIDRQQLRGLLLDSVPAARIRWGCRIQQVARSDADGSMAVHMADGTVESGFRLVIGADGAWSKVRPLVTPARPQYSGYIYLQTSISPSNPIYASVLAHVRAGTCLAVGVKKSLITQRMSSGTFNVYIAIPLPEEWPQQDGGASSLADRCRELVRTQYADWSPELTRWVLQSDGAFYVWALYAMPPEQLNWQPVPGVTLAGDAAHVSTPFAGEGVNCAMHDSLELVRAILKHGLDGLDAAVAEYEKTMLVRGQELITKSHNNGTVLFGDNALPSMKKMFSELS